MNRLFSQFVCLLLLTATIIILVVVSIMTCVLLVLAFTLLKLLSFKHLRLFRFSQPSSFPCEKIVFSHSKADDDGNVGLFLTSKNSFSTKYLTGESLNATQTVNKSDIRECQ